MRLMFAVGFVLFAAFIATQQGELARQQITGQDVVSERENELGVTPTFQKTEEVFGPEQVIELLARTKLEDGQSAKQALNVFLKNSRDVGDLDGRIGAAREAEVCQSDLGYSGPGNAILEICGQHLRSGRSALLKLEKGVPNAKAWLILGTTYNPSQHAALPGYMIVPGNYQFLPISLDRNGEYALLVSGFGQDATLFAQIMYSDSSIQPYNLGISNAVVIEFLSAKTKLIKVVGARVSYDNRGPIINKQTAMDRLMQAKLLFELISYDQFRMFFAVSDELKMPHPFSRYNIVRAINDSEALLQEQHPEIALPYRMAVFTESLWGVGGGARGFINNKDILMGPPSLPYSDIIVHELGHAFGTGHANAFLGSPSNQVEEQYGDLANLMGGGMTGFINMGQKPLYFDPKRMVHLGWVDASNLGFANNVAGQTIRMASVDNPNNKVPGATIAGLLMRYTPEKDILVWYKDNQVRIMETHFTENLPTLDIELHQSVGEIPSQIYDQTPNSGSGRNNLVDVGLPLNAEFNAGDFSVFNRGSVGNDVLIEVKQNVGSPKPFYADRIPNFVLDHTQQGNTFVRDNLTITAKEVLSPGQPSSIKSLRFVFVNAFKEGRQYIRGKGPLPPPPILNMSSPIFQGGPPYEWQWVTNTSQMTNSAFYLVAIAKDFKGRESIRATPVMLDNTKVK